MNFCSNFGRYPPNEWIIGRLNLLAKVSMQIRKTVWTKPAKSQTGAAFSLSLSWKFNEMWQKWCWKCFFKSVWRSHKVVFCKSLCLGVGDLQIFLFLFNFPFSKSVLFWWIRAALLWKRSQTETERGFCPPAGISHRLFMASLHVGTVYEPRRHELAADPRSVTTPCCSRGAWDTKTHNESDSASWQEQSI